MPFGPQINAVRLEKAENGRRQMAIFANVRGPNKAVFEVFRCYRGCVNYRVFGARAFRETIRFINDTCVYNNGLLYWIRSGLAMMG